MKSLREIQSSPDDGFLLRSLLSTVGFATGPNFIGEVSAPGLEADPLQAIEDEIDHSAMANKPWMLKLLSNTKLKSLVDDAFDGAEALLSRAEIVSSDGSGSWKRAETRIFRNQGALRATIGIIVFIRVSVEPGEMQVVPSSRGTSISASEAALAGSEASLLVPSGSAAVLGIGTVYNLSRGKWLQLAFVRSWVKPDLLFCAALPGELWADAPDFVKQWLGTNVGYPISIEEFLSGEAAIALGQSQGQSGRGI